MDKKFLRTLVLTIGLCGSIVTASSVINCHAAPKWPKCKEGFEIGFGPIKYQDGEHWQQAKAYCEGYAEAALGTKASPNTWYCTGDDSSRLWVLCVKKEPRPMP